MVLELKSLSVSINGDKHNIEWPGYNAIDIVFNVIVITIGQSEQSVNTKQRKNNS